MFRAALSLRLCPKTPSPPAIGQAAKDMTGMAMFSGAAPQRMIRSARAKDAAACSKKASGFFDGGDMKAAADEWRNAVDILRAKECGLGEDVSVLEPLNNLACAVGELGRGTEKLKLLTEHTGLVQKIYGAQHPQYVVSSYNHAAALGDVGRPGEMLRQMKTVLELQRGILPPERRAKHAKVARVLLALADAHARCNDQQARYAALVEALPMVVHHCGPEHPQVASVYLALCDTMLEMWATLRRQPVVDGGGGGGGGGGASAEQSVSESSGAEDDVTLPMVASGPPQTAHEAAAAALRFARGAFKIEEKVIPPTSSHLLTHSRLALLRSRAALSPQMTFRSFAPFLGDIRADVVRHSGDTGKLLVPVFAFAAQDALRRAVDGEKPASELCDAAKEMSELAFQVSIRHFDAVGHIEPAVKLTQQAAVELGANIVMKNGSGDDEKVTLEKVGRCCTEALRRFDEMGAEADFPYRAGAIALRNAAVGDASSIGLVRDILKF